VSPDRSEGNAQGRRGIRGFYARRPLAAWVGTAIVAGLAVGAAVGFSIVKESEPRDTLLDCTLYENDSTLRLTVRGRVTAKDAEAGCGTSTEGLSSASSYWIAGIPPLPEEEPQLICALGSPEEPVTILVEEVPSFASQGERACGTLAGDGWVPPPDAPEIGPGQREYLEAVRQREAVELEEQESREREYAEEEMRNEAVFRCENRAHAAEESELEAIERETRERARGVSGSDEYAIEEEGWKREEEAWRRGEKAVENCEAAGGGYDY